MIRYLEKNEYEQAFDLAAKCFEGAEKSHFDRAIEVVGDFEKEGASSAKRLVSIICHEDFTDKISGELLSRLCDWFFEKENEKLDELREELDEVNARPDISRDMPHFAYLSYICTDSAYRNQGRMKALMEFTLESLREKGYDAALLIPVSESIYEGMGFEVITKIEDKLLLWEMEADVGLDICMGLKI